MMDRDRVKSLKEENDEGHRNSYGIAWHGVA